MIVTEAAALFVLAAERPRRAGETPGSDGAAMTVVASKADKTWARLKCMVDDSIELDHFAY